MKILKLLFLFVLILFLCTCTGTKSTLTINNECEEYFTYLQNKVKREKELVNERGFKKFYIDEKIEVIDGTQPKFSKFLEKLIIHKECLIGKQASFIKPLFLPGDVPENWKDHIHDLYANIEMFETRYEQHDSDIYPIKTIVPFFKTGGIIKRIELTYVSKKPNIMVIHFY